MAITIAANLAKKLPIPGNQFSSQQASITITAEVSDLSQVAAEAQKLYHLAEQAVDAQLAAPVSTVPTQPSTPPPSAAPAPASQQRRASQPYRGQPRRGPAPITDSQLRYLRKLVEQTGASVSGICQEHQVGDLHELTCRDGARLIDDLKMRVPA